MLMTNLEIIQKATIEYNNQTQLAAALKCFTHRRVSQADISKWKKKAEIPAAFVIPFEKVLLEKNVIITRHDINPELYPVTT